MVEKKIFVLVTFIFAVAATAIGQTDTFHLDEVYSLDTDGTIWLQSDDAEVSIVGSNRDNVHVTVDYKLDFDGISLGDYKPFDMNVWTENGNLHIKEKPREMDGMRIGITNKKYTITIETPKNAHLSFSGDDENYKIKNINGKIDVEADDADITCTDCGGKLFTYKLDDGTISMNKGKGMLKMSVDDGNATIKNGSFKKIKLKADDGQFNIHNSARSHSNYQITMGDGALNLNLVEGARSGKVEVSVSTDDGDINIRTNAQKDDQYQISADDADITFNVINGGGTFYIYHDDADISAANAYQVLTSMKGISKYRLNKSGATIRMSVDDANIDLK